MCILQGIVLKNVKKHKKQAAENDVERERK